MSEEVENRQSTACASLPHVPTPRELPAFLPYVLTTLQAPFGVRVDCLTQDEYVPPGKAAKKPPRSSKLATAGNFMPKASQSMPIELASPPSYDNEINEVILGAVHDSHGQLVELAMHEVQVPCMLLKLVVFCAPSHVHFTRLTLHACRLDALALNQLIHVLTDTKVTELSLDNSVLTCGGYHMLLEAKSHLRWLSLERCSVGDDGAAKLAAALHHPRPASLLLKALSLASNAIGDDGALAFAEALRSNRQLQYLNLADNRVTDAGAIPILRTLCEFLLSYEEVLEARRRLMGRLRLEQELYTRIYAQLMDHSAQGPSALANAAKGRKTRKNSSSFVRPSTATSEAIAAKAEALVEEKLGPLFEPFGAEDTTHRDGVVYCDGNWSLSWLNLAYNSLDYASLVELAHVMAIQSSAHGGLVRVVVEGNELPQACVELAAVTTRIEFILNRTARSAASRKQITSSRRK